MSERTLGLVAATVLVYLAALCVERRRRGSWTSPMFVGSLLLIALLALTQTSVRDYEPARRALGGFLDPVMVAFAVPIFKHRAILRAHAATIAAALCAGALSTASIAIALAFAFRFPAGVALALGLKSVTTPVAVVLAANAHAAAGIAALGVFLTARIGEVLGPAILDAAGIRHPLARGLSIGCITTTGGVARIAREGELAAASGALAVGLCAFAVGAIGGLLVPLLAELGAR